ncbi:ABC transporter substrate-binding protein [Nocardia pseudobrasiliensis]|uniref:Peptide/nickel transport system substrate-binding protein n=1 Tax=Nocardia pseudobrasiliensis TaxID=45979 RepID=A0A370HTP3_9NOCA|nr:ABC transporter substrate-binding protein [Nocardia pseudobrasiliensis]RDI60334.1 peptide/nickel transport system substrate-binding protein [Nocardia pseudobrasiliensis]
MRLGRIALALLAIATFATSACGTGQESPGGVDASGSTQAATPPDEQLDTDAAVHVRFALEPTSLNPFTTAGVAVDQILLDNVYQGLVSVDTDAKDKIVPGLASSWDQSGDGLTYTFHLVSGAKFHDGSALTSADVAWSLRQQTAPGSKALRGADYAAISEVSTPDPDTVVLRLSRRDTMLMWKLTQRGGIVYKANTDFPTLDGTDNGSGPFRVTQWNRGSTITLTRVPDYRGPKPKVSAVTFHFIVESNSANNAQLTGQTDIETATDPTLLGGFTGTDKFTILRGTTTDKYTMAFNPAKPELANADVRHAIRQAIDKDAIIKALGAGTRIGSPVPPQDPWYEDLTSIDAYNPDNARKLLAKAGFGGGLQLTLDISNHYPPAISDILVSDFKAVGITLTVRSEEFQTWLSKVYKNHDYEVSLVNHAEARDLGIYVQSGYYFGYDNKQVQQWYQQAMSAESESARDDLLRKAVRQIAEDSPCDWLFLAQGNTVVRKGVFGVPQNETNNRFPLSRLAVAK